MKKTVTNPLMVYRYPESGHLCRKDVFGDLMEFSRDLAPEEYDFIPPTYNLPMDAKRFHTYMKAHPGAVYIAKPQAGSKGDEIALFQDLRDLPYGLEGKDITVQRYLTKPLTLNNFKFDLRVYVVVTGTNPLQAFLCDEGLARFCTEKYQAPVKANFKKTFMHLTNYSQNRNSENFIHAKDMEAVNILKDNNATKRTLSALYDTLS